MASRGIIYACSNMRWMAETLASSRSCRVQMPEMRQELFITASLYAEAKVPVDEAFDAVFPLPEARHDHRPRFDAALQTGLDEAIFIDSDTYFVSPVYELFELLEDYDIAVALAPQYFSTKAMAMGLFDALPNVSAAQPEWNTGIIVAKVNDGFRTMVRQWSDLFEQCRSQGFGMDQASFRSALTKSRLRVAALPNNYNFRANIENNVARDVKILHAHGDLARIASYINEKTSMRVYTPRREEIYGFFPRPVKDFE